MKTSQVQVVGGGLVGSLLAVDLKKKGFNVHVYDKRSDPRTILGINSSPTDRGRSINLILSSRGLAALERVGLLKKALDISVPVWGREIHDRSGSTRVQSYGVTPEDCNFSISRKSLNLLLIQEATELGVEFHFGHELVDLKPKEDVLKFRTSQGIVSVPYKVVLGADGSASGLRRALVAQNLVSDQIEELEWDYKELHMPALAAGKGQMDLRYLHIWPRQTHMLMGLANPDGSFTMTLYLPSTGDSNSFSQLTTPESVQSFLQAEFPDALAAMPEAVAEFQSHPQGRLATVRCSTWNPLPKIGLLGDAAHAIVPFFGQGMNLGFEDVSTLSELLDTHDLDWDAALQDLDQQQRPNANAIADMALENFIEMRDLVADPQFLRMKQIESEIERRFPQEYCSRYSLITRTLVPYRKAKEAGQVQLELLKQLASTANDQTSIENPAQLVVFKSIWGSWLEKQNFKISKFQLPNEIRLNLMKQE